MHLDTPDNLHLSSYFIADLHFRKTFDDACSFLMFYSAIFKGQSCPVQSNFWYYFVVFSGHFISQSLFVRPH